MRTIAFLAVVLISTTLHAQDGFFSHQATDSEAVAKLQVQDRLIDNLRSIIRDLEAKRCPCCDSGECQCGKAQRAQPLASQWKIVMESIPRCDGCKWADENQRPKYLGLGWQWETKHLPGPQPGVRMYPRYLICNGQTCEVIEIDKYVDELDAKLTALLARRNEIPQHDKRGRFLGNW